MRRSIDLNADVGEGCPSDFQIVRIVSSVNVACGGHAGDERTMAAAVAEAIRSGVAIGAHPGHEDPLRFGRESVPISPRGLVSLLQRQVDRLHAVVAGLGGTLTHLKPHGALYHQVAADAELADALAAFVVAYHTPLAVVGPPRGELAEAVLGAGVPYLREGFVDRAYRLDGSIAPRDFPGAVIGSAAEAALQATRIAVNGKVATLGGGEVDLACDTLCVHGDTPGAVQIAEAVRGALADAGWAVRAAPG